MSNGSGGAGSKWAGKVKKNSHMLIASYYWLEEEIEFYGWPTLLPVISQAFKGEKGGNHVACQFFQRQLRGGETSE